MLIEGHEEGYNKRSRQYAADYCRSIGLPMYSKKTFAEVSRKHLYTTSRAKKEHVVIDETRVCGWYRTMNGYVPLFRSKDVDDLPLSDLIKHAYHAVEHGRTGDLVALLECKTRQRCVKYVLAGQIDSLIAIAISEKQHQCYLFLVEYKHKNDLFHQISLELD